MPGLRPGGHPGRRGRAGRPDDAGPITIRRTKELAMTTVDGLITGRALGAAGQPVFASVAEERLHRKQELAAAFRVFGRFGFSEGVAGHITARDPEYPDRFWVNPSGMSFSQIIASDPDLFG
jgi:hypothetical protein